MKQITHHQGSIRAMAMLLVAIAVLTFSPQGAFAQANDFFSSTQSDNQRSTATTPTAPGFDPCRGGTATATSCVAPLASSPPLLDPRNLGDNATNTAGLFAKLGPGAVTDNMFGIIERPTNPLACGGISVFTGGPGELNCGSTKFDLTSQNQTIPTVGTNLTTAMVSNTTIDMASGTGDAQHRSQMENAFVWNPTAGSITMPVNPLNMPTIVTTPAAQLCLGGSAAAPRVCGQFSLKETTALSAGTNVAVSQTASWSTTNSDAGAMGGNPIVTWESRIVQAEFVGGGTFDQTLQGSFTYNDITSFTATQYPNGQSQTIRASNGGEVPVESIP